MTTPTAADLERVCVFFMANVSELRRDRPVYAIVWNEAGEQAILAALAEARADAERRAVRAEEANAALRGALDEFMIRLERMSTEAGERWEASRSRADSDRLHDINSIVGSAGTIHRYLSAPPAGTGSERDAARALLMIAHDTIAYLYRKGDEPDIARKIRDFVAPIGEITPADLEWAKESLRGIPGEGETKP